MLIRNKTRCRIIATLHHVIVYPLLILRADRVCIYQDVIPGIVISFLHTRQLLHGGAHMADLLGIQRRMKINARQLILRTLRRIKMISDLIQMDAQRQK